MLRGLHIAIFQVNSQGLPYTTNIVDHSFLQEILYSLGFQDAALTLSLSLATYLLNLLIVALSLPGALSLNFTCAPTLELRTYFHVFTI